MPGYGNSMGAISFCGRTTVSRDTNSDNIIKPPKPKGLVKPSRERKPREKGRRRWRKKYWGIE